MNLLLPSHMQVRSHVVISYVLDDGKLQVSVFIPELTQNSLLWPKAGPSAHSQAARVSRAPATTRTTFGPKAYY